jgi:hypothetical protein
MSGKNIKNVKMFWRYFVAKMNVLSKRNGIRSGMGLTWVWASGRRFSRKTQRAQLNVCTVYIQKCRGSALVSMRIPIQIQGFDDQKLEKKFTAEINLYFFDQKLQFTYSRPRTCKLQKSSSLKMRIRIQPTKINADPGPQHWRTVYCHPPPPGWKLCRIVWQFPSVVGNSNVCGKWYGLAD